MAWRIELDGEFSTIEEVDGEVDGYDTFATLGAAKEALLADLRHRRDGLRAAIDSIRRMTTR